MENIVKNLNTLLIAEDVNEFLIVVAIKAEATALANAGEITEAEKQGIIILAEELA